MITLGFATIGIIALLFLALGIIVRDTNSKKTILIFSATLIVSGVGLAYCTEPYPGSDLSRYFIELNNYARYGWSYAFSANSLYASTPITCVFFYLVSLTNNYHLLPAISAGITLIVWMYVLWDQCRCFNLSGRAYYLTVLLVLGGMNGVLSILIGVRQHLAISLMLLAIWVDLRPSSYKHRNRAKIIFLYCIPLLIHYGMLLIYIVRVAYGVVLRLRLSRISGAALVVACALCSGVVLEYLSNSIGGVFFETIFEKYTVYQDTSIPDIRVQLLQAGEAAVFMLLVYVLLGWMSRKAEGIKYCSYLFMVAVFAVASSLNYTLCERTFSICLYGCYPIISMMLGRRRESRLVFLLMVTILVFLVLGFAYELVSLTHQWQLALV